MSRFAPEPNKGGSVKELRSWLTKFGEQNKQHFEVNKVKQYSSIRRKIQLFEENICVATSGSSSQDSRDRTPYGEINIGKKEKLSLNKSSGNDTQNVPVFRDFDAEKISGIPQELHDFRVLSINTSGKTPTGIDGTQNPSQRDLFGSLQSAAFRRCLLDDTRSSLSERESEFLDSLSKGSDYHTDPGPPDSTVWGRRLARRQKMTDSSSVLCRSLPRLLCKSTNTNEDGLSPYYETLAIQDVSFIPGDSYNPASPLVNKASPSSGNDSIEPTTSLTDTAPSSAWSEEEVPVQSVHISDIRAKMALHQSTMMSVFGQEVDGMNEEPCPKASVTTVVQRFGGLDMKLSSVERRKQELERQWAGDRLPKHSKKVAWTVVNGRYKKKVVLDYASDQ